MNKVAVIAALIPWLLLTVALVIRSIDGTGSIPHIGILWLVVSPAWFAAGCLVSYRNGQWSKK